MRSVRYHHHGGPEVLQLDEVPAPTPAEGQVRIAVEAVGANFIDTVLRRGSEAFPRPLPGALTGEVVGRVTVLGRGVDTVAVGDRVAALSEDAFADYIVADAQWVAPVSDDVDAGEATVLAMTAPLALRLLRQARLSPGETVLVQAAAGGTGHLLVQLAKVLGARTVIGTASSAKKLDFIREQGADFAIDSSDPAWPEQVRAVAPDGVDVTLDAVGGAVFDHGLDLLAPLGRMVTYGAVGGTLPTVPAQALFGMKSVTGLSFVAWRAARPGEAEADLVDAAGYWSAGRVRTAVHAVFPLAETRAVHELLERREHLGLVVAVP